MTMFEIASRIVETRPDNAVTEALRQADITSRSEGRAKAMPFLAAAILLCRNQGRAN